VKLPDVNILLQAFRADLTEHAATRAWLTDLLASGEPFIASEQVLSGFLRIVTMPEALKEPTPMSEALAFTDRLRAHHNAVLAASRPGQWQIFVDLCRQPGVRGRLVPDAWLAAQAIDWGAELVSFDGDFARFPGLRWRHPLQPRR
jgi:hypothetical protein